jgi:hypothetical protein
MERMQAFVLELDGEAVDLYLIGEAVVLLSPA